MLKSTCGLAYEAHVALPIWMHRILYPGCVYIHLHTLYVPRKSSCITVTVMMCLPQVSDGHLRIRKGTESSLFAPSPSAPLSPEGRCLFPGHQAPFLCNTHNKSCAARHTNEKLCGPVPNYNHQLSCQRELSALVVSLLDFGPWWAAIRHESVTWAEPGSSLLPCRAWGTLGLDLVLPIGFTYCTAGRELGAERDRRRRRALRGMQSP